MSVFLQSLRFAHVASSPWGCLLSCGGFRSQSLPFAMHFPLFIIRLCFAGEACGQCGLTPHLSRGAAVDGDPFFLLPSSLAGPVLVQASGTAPPATPSCIPPSRTLPAKCRHAIQLPNEGGPVDRCRSWVELVSCCPRPAVLYPTMSSNVDRSCGEWPTFCCHSIQRVFD